MLMRHDVVQGILSLYEDPRYLEIGVSRGVTFHQVRAAAKVAVDPRFVFDVEAARAENREARYFEVTSDHYFGEIVAPDERFDVVYLDGLHTAEQTLRDLLNALSYLKPDGVIVIDDVKPVTALAAIPDRRTFRQVRAYLGSGAKAWMGDVYKVVWFIDTFLQQLSWRTVKENHGQAVVWQKRRSRVRPRTIQAVGLQSFEQFVTDIDTLRVTPFEEIVGTIRSERDGSDAHVPRSGPRPRQGRGSPGRRLPRRGGDPARGTPGDLGGALRENRRADSPVAAELPPVVCLRSELLLALPGNRNSSREGILYRKHNATLRAFYYGGYFGLLGI